MQMFYCFFSRIQRDFYQNTSSTIATPPDPLAVLRNSVYWQSSPGRRLSIIENEIRISVE